MSGRALALPQVRPEPAKHGLIGRTAAWLAWRSARREMRKFERENERLSRSGAWPWSRQSQDAGSQTFRALVQVNLMPRSR